MTLGLPSAARNIRIEPSRDLGGGYGVSWRLGFTSFRLTGPPIG